MDAQQFLAEFGHIVEAQGGVAQLRSMIFSLAVAGDLVSPATATAISALPLVASIEQKKARHPVQKKVVPKQESIVNFSKRVPPHWAVCRLGDLVLTITGGGTPSKRNPSYWNGDIPWASVKDLKDHKYLSRTADHITVEGLTGSSSNLISSGNIIVCTRMGLGKIAINSVPIAINQDLKALELPAEVDRNFFYILYKTLTLKGTGTTVEGIKQEELLALPVALPSTEEQSSIVEKVDVLIAQCDRLESEQQQLRELQKKLRQTTLQAVVLNSPHELQTTWARVADNFGKLFCRPEDVDDFVANLQDMAVRGLLSLPSDATPELDEIVSTCDASRAEYVAAGLIRRQKVISDADTDVIYPDHWGIIPFDKVAIVIGGVTKGRNLRGRATLTCPYLAVANVQRGFFKLHGLKTIEIGAEELEKYLVQDGDLLVTEGGDWDKVGRTAIWRGGVDNCLHQNHIFKARIPSKSLSNEWVELVFNSGVGRDYFAGASKQTTNLASINMTQLRGFPLPIPPLAEQQEILEKLAVLTARCNVWREQLDRKQTLASLLATAAIASITGINAPSQEEAPLKAPQTELIAPLRLGQTPDLKAQAPLATLLARHQGELAAKDLWQRFGGEIDAFYAQLKHEVAHGWILEPAVAEMKTTG